jgi:hypothetical protein
VSVVSLQRLELVVDVVEQDRLERDPRRDQQHDDDAGN